MPTASKLLSTHKGEKLVTLSKKAKAGKLLAVILVVSLKLSRAKMFLPARTHVNSTTGGTGLASVPLAFLTDSQFLCKVVSARFEFSLMVHAVAHAKRESAMFLGVVMTAFSPSGLNGVHAILRVLALAPPAIKHVDVAFSVPHAHASHAMF